MINDVTWEQAVKPTALQEQAVHLFSVTFTDDPQHCSQLLGCLSEDEKARAQRFKQTLPRLRFIQARGILRQLLSLYHYAKPAALEFTYNEQGKPSLLNSAGLEFNLSHSQQLVLLAVRYQHCIGIDIEHTKRNTEGIALTKRFFSQDEYHALEHLNPEQQQTTFFRLWTHKEAIIKALGEGITYPLHQYEFNVQANHKMTLRHIKGNTQLAKHWQFVECSPHPEYAATLASPAPIMHIKAWHCHLQQILN